MRAHRTDLVSFAFGMLFIGFAAWWLVAQILGLVLPPVGWFLAGALLLIGVLGLAGALRSARSARSASARSVDDPPTSDAPAAGPAVGETEWSAGRAGWPTGAGTDRTDEWPTQAVTDRDDPADEWPTEAVTDRDDRADEWPAGLGTDRAGESAVDGPDRTGGRADDDPDRPRG